MKKPKSPQGVSQWAEHGKKYGYWQYFESQTRLQPSDLYPLNWISILNRAIKSRPTSWSKNPVVEWRNASDEVCNAVISALREKGLCDDELEKFRKVNHFFNPTRE